MARSIHGVYTPPESRKFAGEWFSLAWWTGINSKYRANQAKKFIKMFGSKPYQVRVVEADKAHYIYTRPTLTRADSSKIIRMLG